MQKKERIFIIPNRFGLLYLVATILMLILGAAHANNLINLLAFFMLSLAFVGMVQTNSQLKGLRVESMSVEPAFAGGALVIDAGIRNISHEPRSGVMFNAPGLPALPASILKPPGVVPARGSLRQSARHRAGRRGRHQLTRVRLHTVHPLGLFYAWTFHPVAKEYLVFPEPKGTSPLPFRRVSSLDAIQADLDGARSGEEDFHSHRAFRAGDSSRHIDWKAHARGRPLLIKEFEGGTPLTLVLDYEDPVLQALAPDVEARLSQLTVWVREAQAQGLVTTLLLPGTRVGPGAGLQHWRRCLEALAVFEGGRA